MLDRQVSAEGFFFKHHKNVRSTLDEVTLKNFTNLECDNARIHYLANVPLIKEFDPMFNVRLMDPTFSMDGKSAERARTLKNDGNAAVQKGDWAKALDMYTKSYVYMPTENAAEIAVIIANRSAALYHLNLYEFALVDIEMALSLNYPKELRFKVLDRKARCYLALKWNKEAIEAFKKTISALDESNLASDKRSKMQMDAKIMLEILNKSAAMTKIKEPPRKVEKKTRPLPPVYMKPHSTYGAATSALTIEKNTSEGRYAVAMTDIAVGEVIVVENAHCNVLLSEYSKTHCQNCFEKCLAAVPCPTCANVVFCGEECKNIALKSYHRYECPILKILWMSGCSITCHMALRIIVQKPLTYFINMKSKLGRADDNNNNGKYCSEDYAMVYNLECNEKLRSKSDYFHRTHMAVFLLNLLKKTDYLSTVGEMSLDEVETFIGELILKNLQLLQFNSHEVFELLCEKPAAQGGVFRRDLGKSVFLGGGLYPTLALFNHSCDPSVVRYFQGGAVVVRAIKNIKSGQRISENYGPIFTRKAIGERRAELKNQYWFDCHCDACENNWPKFEDIDEGVMRFKCDSNSICNNVIMVPYNCPEFMLACDACKKYTNIMKGLKSLQDTEVAQRIGKDYMEKGDYGNALKKFIEELKAYDETLVPPFKDYHLCQQNIRRCMLTFGNINVK